MHSFSFALLLGSVDWSVQTRKWCNYFHNITARMSLEDSFNVRIIRGMPASIRTGTMSIERAWEEKWEWKEKSIEALISLNKISRRISQPAHKLGWKDVRHLIPEPGIFTEWNTRTRHFYWMKYRYNERRLVVLLQMTYVRDWLPSSIHRDLSGLGILIHPVGPPTLV